MAFKDLLVHLDDSAACSHRIDAVLALARRHEASVIGMALALESTISRYVGKTFPSSIDQAQRDIVKSAADSAIAKFEKAAADAGVKHSTECISCTALTAPAELSYHARHADMTFLGQPDVTESGAGFQESLLDGVLFGSGRPVYVVPYIGRFQVPVRKAVIAWDGSKKAVRAVNDAIPLLKDRGGEVVVLVINPEARKSVHGEHPGEAMAAHIERHGISAKVKIENVNEISVDAAILNFLADASADLLIMGASGHSRLRERAFGGVTHGILRGMTTPVLISE